MLLIISKLLFRTSLISCIIILINCESENELKTVLIESGSIRGLKLKTLYENKKYFSFRGIPYAKPPIGDLRFKLPEKPEPWSDVKDVLETGSECIQMSSLSQGINVVSGNEDCLFLNVYTPDLKFNKKLPVMFFIHGGGYEEMSSSDLFFGPDFLINENVIVVTINYRLGPLGFLSIEGLPKNVGFYDQLLALKWVNKNIEIFGGDKNEITIFGESAGSSSVHFQILSPLTKNLFKRAILQSGTALDTWSYGDKSYNQNDKMIKFAHEQGFNSTNLKDVIGFLQNVNGNIFFAETYINPFSVKVGQRGLILTYKPVVDEIFIPDYPKYLILNSKSTVDLLIGFTANESMGFSPDLKDPKTLPEFNEKFLVNFPRLEFAYEFSSEIYKKMSAEVKTFYFGKEITENDVLKTIDLQSDVLFNYNSDFVAKSNAKHVDFKTYYYKFSVDDKLNALKMLTNTTNFPGTSHFDEICYLFRCNCLNKVYESLEATSNSRQIIKTMSKLWTNFAKEGNPTPNGEWLPVTSNETHFMDIKNEGPVPGLEPYGDRFAFWTGLFEKDPTHDSLDIDWTTNKNSCNKFSGYRILV